MPSISAVYNPAPPSANPDRDARSVEGKDAASKSTSTPERARGDLIDISAEARRLVAAEQASQAEKARNEASGEEPAAEENAAEEFEKEMELYRAQANLRERIASPGDQKTVFDGDGPVVSDESDGKAQFSSIEAPRLRPAIPPEESLIETAFRLSVPSLSGPDDSEE